MPFAGEQRLDAPQEAVWAALHDPDILRRCIPGCESVERISDAETRALATASIGSSESRFTTRLTLRAVDPSSVLKITGQSQGGSAGFATGSADLRVEPVDSKSTLVKYEADVTFGGRLAELGNGAMDPQIRKVADDFFACLNGALSNPAHRRRATTKPGEPAARASLGAPFWLAITMVQITVVLYIMALM